MCGPLSRQHTISINQQQYSLREPCRQWQATTLPATAKMNTDNRNGVMHALWDFEKKEKKKTLSWQTGTDRGAEWERVFSHFRNKFLECTAHYRKPPQPAVGTNILNLCRNASQPGTSNSATHYLACFQPARSWLPVGCLDHNLPRDCDVFLSAANIQLNESLTLTYFHTKPPLLRFTFHCAATFGQNTCYWRAGCIMPSNAHHLNSCKELPLLSVTWHWPFTRAHFVLVIGNDTAVRPSRADLSASLQQRSLQHSAVGSLLQPDLVLHLNQSCCSIPKFQDRWMWIAASRWT